MGLILSQGLPIIKFSWDLLQKYVQKEIDKQVVLKAQERINAEISQFIRNVHRRTLIYFSFSVVHLIVIFTIEQRVENQLIFAALFLLSLGFILLVIFNSIKSFFRAVRYFENFENHIKEILQKEFKKTATEKASHRIFLWINSKEAKDYYHLVLEQIIDTCSKWILSNKKSFYLRLLVYFMASFAFSHTLKMLL